MPSPSADARGAPGTRRNVYSSWDYRIHGELGGRISDRRRFRAGTYCRPRRGFGTIPPGGRPQVPKAELIGIDLDPMATLIARGNLAAAGFEARSRILLADYRDIKLHP